MEKNSINRKYIKERFLKDIFISVNNENNFLLKRNSLIKKKNAIRIKNDKDLLELYSKEIFEVKVYKEVFMIFSVIGSYNVSDNVIAVYYDDKSYKIEDIGFNPEYYYNFLSKKELNLLKEKLKSKIEYY